MAKPNALPPGAQRGAVEERFDPETWQSTATDFWHSIFSGDHPGGLPPWMTADDSLTVDDAMLAAAGIAAFAGVDTLAFARGGGGGGGKPGSGGGGGSTVTDTYISGNPAAADASEYNVQVNFLGTNWTDALKADFKAAANYLSSQITGDLPDIYSLSLFGGNVDDIVISASLVTIDGTGKVLGQAGPTYIRTSDGLPVAGTMQFDVADAANFDGQGLFDDIVLHEMLHTLGFGSLWSQFGLVDTYTDTHGTTQTTDDTVDYRFHGVTANQLAASSDLTAAAYAAANAGTIHGIPVETDGGSGTAGSHWDETTFGNELMTGWINNANDIAPMTIGSLQDLGYQTIYG